jgi:hypothetical protein
MLIYSCIACQGARDFGQIASHAVMEVSGMMQPLMQEDERLGPHQSAPSFVLYSGIFGRRYCCCNSLVGGAVYLPVTDHILFLSSPLCRDGQQSSMKMLMGIAGPKLVPAIERVLAKSCDWDFNVFELDEVSQHNPLSTLGFFFMKQVRNT